MVSRLNEIVLDCPDPGVLAPFWCAALGLQVIDADNEVVELYDRVLDDEARLAEFRAGPVVPTLVLVRTPDQRDHRKSSVHLDISPIDRSHDEEVARLLALGATHADIGQTGDESWTVLADPAGNVFCVLRSLAPGHVQA